MAYTRSITDQLGEWPTVSPGQVLATKLPDSDEALFSVGRRRRDVRTVLSREEALTAVIELTEAFELKPGEITKARRVRERVRSAA